eukprot:CAMPEP_0184552690 /NCGR_PEP_ID=MMETSP0199_2-20130426/29731_1 /TAXON_ID=1112570 /ORGANISM="Thraustochytrium sp., Strain LLF1b" /LENGTH=606 /DNA_ID=CAMNT_0026948243 /DNA_START=176 /DNA_END=1996 /DNA_ORIENTATION=-
MNGVEATPVQQMLDTLTNIVRCPHNRSTEYDFYDTQSNTETKSKTLRRSSKRSSKDKTKSKAKPKTRTKSRKVKDVAISITPAPTDACHGSLDEPADRFVAAPTVWQRDIKTRRMSMVSNQEEEVVSVRSISSLSSQSWPTSPDFRQDKGLFPSDRTIGYASTTSDFTDSNISTATTSGTDTTSHALVTSERADTDVRQSKNTKKTLKSNRENRVGVLNSCKENENTYVAHSNTGSDDLAQAKDDFEQQATKHNQTGYKASEQTPCSQEDIATQDVQSFPETDFSPTEHQAPSFLDDPILAAFERIAAEEGQKVHREWMDTVAFDNTTKREQGIVTKQSFDQNELVFRENPDLRLLNFRHGDMLALKIKLLSLADQEKNTPHHTQDNQGKWTEKKERRRTVCIANMRAKTEMGYYVLRVASAIRHSCAPNVDFRMEGNCIEVYALRPIAQGEELYVSYVDNTMVTSERKEALLKHFDIKCHCTLCSSDDLVLTENEEYNRLKLVDLRDKIKEAFEKRQYALALESSVEFLEVLEGSSTLATPKNLLNAEKAALRASQELTNFEAVRYWMLRCVDHTHIVHGFKSSIYESLQERYGDMRIVQALEFL